MNLINNKWKKNILWESCMLSSIAHAIMMTRYPEFNYEYSWDGKTCSIQNEELGRGSITFTDTFCIGCIRNEKSERLIDTNEYTKYLINMPKEIAEIAEKETLQYLLEEIDGEVKPSITSIFWCTNEGMFCTEQKEKLYENGLNIIERELLEKDKQIEELNNYYDMNHDEGQLLKELFEIKLNNPNEKIYITEKQIKAMNLDNEIGVQEMKDSFKEIGIIV